MKIKRVLIGLGNPGSEYTKTRHNIGFDIIDFLAEKYDFDAFKTKYDALIAKGKIGPHEIALIKPMSYMNNSGIPLQKFMQFFKISSEKMIVFHDEIELATSRIKMKRGGGHAGHNGLRSIDQHLGHEYWRIRIGVDRPIGPQSVSSYVLQKFSDLEQAKIDQAKELIIDNINDIITLQFERFNSNAGKFFEKIKTIGESIDGI